MSEKYLKKGWFWEIYALKGGNVNFHGAWRVSKNSLEGMVEWLGVKMEGGTRGQAKIYGRYADLVGTKRADRQIFSMVFHIFFHEVLRRIFLKKYYKNVSFGTIVDAYIAQKLKKSVCSNHITLRNLSFILQ